VSCFERSALYVSYVSTQKASAVEGAWVPRTHVHKKWSAGAGGSASPRTSGFDGVTALHYLCVRSPVIDSRRALRLSRRVRLIPARCGRMPCSAFIA
jgi:hypothetical protein